MSAFYGKQIRFTARYGSADALTERLIVAGEDLTSETGCLLWLTSRTPENPDVVWLTEVWVSEAVQDEWRQRERVRQAREEAASLVASVQETVLDVLGGKGV